jgi:hypothetical protein
MRASNLPDGFKQTVLRWLRNQMGDAAYHRAVADLGEDGLVELFLDCLQQNQSGRLPGTPLGPRVPDWRTAWDTLRLPDNRPKIPQAPLRIFDPAWRTQYDLPDYYRVSQCANPWAEASQFVVGVLGATWPFLLIFLAGGPGGIAFVVGAFVLLFFGTAAVKAYGAGATLGFLVAVGALAGLGVLLWVAVPWLFVGVRQWWSWLAGHF